MISGRDRGHFSVLHPAKRLGSGRNPWTVPFRPSRNAGKKGGTRRVPWPRAQSGLDWLRWTCSLSDDGHRHGARTNPASSRLAQTRHWHGRRDHHQVFCPGDAQWYDLRLETRETRTRVRTRPALGKQQTTSSHVTTRRC